MRHPAPKKKPDVAKIILLAIGGLVILILLGVIFSGESKPRTVAAAGGPAPTVTASEPAAEPNFTEPAPVDYAPKKSDWLLKVKIKEKQCYGYDFGCSLTAKVSADFNGVLSQLPDEGTVEITYKLTGDTGGPIVGTVEIDVSDQTTTIDEQWMDTRNRGVNPKAVVTAVEYSEW